MNTFLNNLTWRAAVKSYDGSKKTEQSNIDEIERAAIYAPTSFGFQPVRVIRVDDEAVRKQIFEASGQKQILDASKLYVITSFTDSSDELMHEFLDAQRLATNASVESLEGKKQYIGGFVNSLGAEFKNWAAKQSYLVLGFMLAAAAELKVDSTPMEGFDKAKVGEILGLPSQNLSANTLLTVGVRSSEDTYAALPKARQKILKVI